MPNSAHTRPPTQLSELLFSTLTCRAEPGAGGEFGHVHDFHGKLLAGLAMNATPYDGERTSAGENDRETNSKLFNNTAEKNVVSGTSVWRSEMRVSDVLTHVLVDLALVCVALKARFKLAFFKLCSLLLPKAFSTQEDS